MSGGRTYDPGVFASVAQLPQPPEYWSYSTLKEIESCPRRYILGHASYPDLWPGWGYPQQPSTAALFGDVVHDSLERIIRAFARAGCTYSGSAEAVGVLRGLGGYSAVIKDVLDARLARLDGNPRVGDDRRARLQQHLEDRVPEARTDIQGYLQRMTLRQEPRAEGVPSGQATPIRQPLGHGPHPEATLRADHLRVKGRIDLLTVTSEQADIVDYKTGAQDPSHLDQLRFYAMLWDQDEVANRHRKPPGKLAAAYVSTEVSVSAPDAHELADLSTRTAQRVATADAEVVAIVPKATPGDHCTHCPVRSLCGTYWREVTPQPSEVRDGAWFDYAGIVGEQNGIRSWWMVDKHGQKELLLRTPPGRTFSPGQRVRMLGLRRDEDPEIIAPVATMTGNTELFVVVGNAP